MSLTFKRLCECFGSVLTALCTPRDAHESVTREDFNSTVLYRSLRGAIHAIVTLFIKIVTSQSAPPERKGKTVYDVLSLFKKMLNCHHIACQALGHDSAFQEVLKIISDLLHALVSRLVNAAKSSKSQHTSEAHYSSLLEGTLYLLLDRAGNLLYILTFSMRRTEGIEGDIMSSTQVPTKVSPLAPPRKESSTLGHGTELDATVEAARVESSSLTPLLRLLLPTPAHFSFIATDFLRSPSHHSSVVYANADEAVSGVPSLPNDQDPVLHESGMSKKHSLLSVPLDKIQHTLLRSMFGPTFGINDEKVLRLPAGLADRDMIEAEVREVAADEIGNSTIQSEENDPDDDVDEFVKEMWCRVGWDILIQDRHVGGGADPRL